MRKFLLELYCNEDGCVAVEWMVVASVLTLGAIAGLFLLQNTAEDSSADRPAALVR
jgi:hypothetical protein